MSPQRSSDGQDKRRQRLDSDFTEMLQELRIAQAGVQIIFAFLLTLPFQSKFEGLSTFQLTLYLATLACSATTVVLFVGPVALHRKLFGLGAKDDIVGLTTRLTVWGLLFLALTMTGGVLLVVDLVFSRPLALVVAASLALLAVLVWVLLPRRAERQARERRSS